MILDHVHDRPIELSDIRLDQHTHILSIPITTVDHERDTGPERFLFLWRRKRPVLRSELSVHHAVGYEIQDNAQIGTADINTIDMDDDKVVIACTTYVTIRVEVTAIEVELRVSDDVVGTASAGFSIAPPHNRSPA